MLNTDAAPVIVVGVAVSASAVTCGLCVEYFANRFAHIYINVLFLFLQNIQRSFRTIMEKKVGKHNNNNDNDDDKMFVMTYKKASTNLNKILGFQQTEKLSLHVSKYFSIYLHICSYFDARMNTLLAHINN